MQRLVRERSSGPPAGRSRALLAIRSQRGNPAVGRVDDQGRAQSRHYRVAARKPELVIGAADVDLGGAVAPVPVVVLEELPCPLDGFLLREELLVSKVRGTFQRRERCAGPDTLEVWFAIGRAGCLRRERKGGDNQDKHFHGITLYSIPT